MRKRNQKSKNKSMFRFASTSILLFGAVALFWMYHGQIIQVPNAEAQADIKPTVYPAQYSDAHITENAIVASSRFSHVTRLDKSSLTASVIGASQVSSAPRSLQGAERGTWLWTPMLEITPAYQHEILSGAVKNGIKNIYISTDTYLDIFVMPDGAEKDARKKLFDDTLEGFIVEAHRNGITVDAEGGWRNWAEEGNTYKAFAVLDHAIEFNKTHTEKLRGFQYDVEPYLLDAYKKDKPAVLSRFLDLVQESIVVLGNSNLQLSVVIPEFYDGVSSETPLFTYNGTSDYALGHLLRDLEMRQGSNIIVMSYRNFSVGDDGSIDVSKDEIEDAGAYHTKVIIAQETGEVNPPYTTFYNTSKTYLDKQIALIQKTFAGDKSFGGTAIHYVNALMQLK